MEVWQFCLLMSAIYIAPNAPKEAGVAMGVIFVLGAGMALLFG